MIVNYTKLQYDTARYGTARYVGNQLLDLPQPYLKSLPIFSILYGTGSNTIRYGTYGQIDRNRLCIFQKKSDDVIFEANQNIRMSLI